MTRESEMPGGAEAPRDAAEDTVELELSAAEQLELARAGEAALLSPRSIPDGPGYDTFIYTRTRRADVLGTITFAAIVCAITTALGWHALISEPPPAAVASGGKATTTCQVNPTPGVYAPSATVLYGGPVPGTVAGVTQFNVQIGTVAASNFAFQFSFSLTGEASVAETVWIAQ